MRRILGSVPLSALLLAGCAGHDAEPGFTAPQETEGTSEGSMSAATTGAGTDESSGDSTGTGTGTTGAVSGTSGEAPTPTEGAATGESSGGTGEPGTTTGTGTTGSTGETDTESTGADTMGGHSFAVDIWPIFAERCSCHQDANGAGKLRLAMEDAYTNMIDMPSKQAPMLMIVKPGSAQDSYLWHKLNDTQDEVGGKGKRMPPGGKLKMAELELVQQWIDEGAMP